MEFEEVIKKRFSIRAFEKKKIEKEKLEKILELSNLSPSAGNLQARKVIVVEDEKIKRKIVRACFGQSFILEAPVVVVVFADLKESARRYGLRGQNFYSFQDATIFAAYFQLIAVNEGLDTCWVGAFDEEKIKKILEVPIEYQPVAVLPLGYKKEESFKRERKHFKDLILKNF